MVTRNEIILAQKNTLLLLSHYLPFLTFPLYLFPFLLYSTSYIPSSFVYILHKHLFTHSTISPLCPYLPNFTLYDRPYFSILHQRINPLEPLQHLKSVNQQLSVTSESTSPARISHNTSIRNDNKSFYPHPHNDMAPLVLQLPVLLKRCG